MATSRSDKIPATGMGWCQIWGSSSLVAFKRRFLIHGVQDIIYFQLTLYPGSNTGLIVDITYSVRLLTRGMSGHQTAPNLQWTLHRSKIAGWRPSRPRPLCTCSGHLLQPGSSSQVWRGLVPHPVGTQQMY